VPIRSSPEPGTFSIVLPALAAHSAAHVSVIRHVSVRHLSRPPRSLYSARRASSTGEPCGSGAGQWPFLLLGYARHAVRMSDIERGEDYAACDAAGVEEVQGKIDSGRWDDLNSKEGMYARQWLAI
jgi:hypothetical protein